MRVALDTNVVISALAFPGSVSDKAMTRMILSDCQILLCNQVLTELRMVVRRKFPEKTESIERFLRDFSYLEISESSSVNLSSEQIPDVRDPSDLPILLSAITAKADILVTGDEDLLSVASLITTLEILSPSEFLRREEQHR
jgi:putative PIN family toxin of toxin-antitoxin system